ncbi:MAG: hypothetical protein ACQEQV_07270 [Fibrobacterota bacterium]
MDEVKNRLIREAVETYKLVRPCGGKGSLEECFSREGDRLMLWFNTHDESTHIVMAEV